MPAFKRPESRNAAATLVWMAALLTVMFLGTSVLAYLYGVHPSEKETVISQFARIMFKGGFGWFYYVVQATTALILVLAVFSGALVAAFGADENRLIPLYAVGVFLSFTLSQAGMVLHWLRVRGQADEPDARSWRKSIVINGLSAVATFVVLVVFVATKFVHGAWVVVLLIPLLVMMFSATHAHYLSVARQLTTEGLERPRDIRHTVVVPISGIHRGVIGALEYAKAISGGEVRAVYVAVDEEATRKLKEKWEQWGSSVKLVVLPSPYRSLVRPLLRYLYGVRRRGRVEIITVVLPEFVPARWWQHLLHIQSSLLLKGALLFRRGIIVTSVPYHLEK